MYQYKVDARNHALNEILEGVRFVNGKATVDENTINTDIHSSVDDTVKALEALGFIAEVVKDPETGKPVEVVKTVTVANETPDEQPRRRVRRDSSDEQPKG